MTGQIHYPRRVRVQAPRPTFALFQDKKLQNELRNTIRAEAMKNTFRMEHVRLTNALDQLTPAMRGAANRRLGELEKILK